MQFLSRRIAGFLLSGAVALLALSFCRPGLPAAAQGFVTPTPLPAVKSAQDAANLQAQQAQASLNQAAQLEAQAEEIRRNAAAQAAQAAQAYADARAAAAAQNAAAIGEAIGRGEAALSQLQASVDGLTALNATQAAQLQQLNGVVISQTNTINQLRAENRDTKQVNAALMTQQAQNENLKLLGYIVSGFLFLVAFGILAALVWYVIQRRQVKVIPPLEPFDKADATDGEYTTGQGEAAE